MIFAAKDLYYGIKRRKVIQEEMEDCMKMWRFVDNQLHAELALAQLQIDWAKERLQKQTVIFLLVVILIILVKGLV